MKPIVINNTSEILEKYTVSSSGLTGFSHLGTEVMSCTVPNHLIGFPLKVVKILELFCNAHTGCSVFAMHTPKERYNLVNIKGNSENTVFFETFRKCGIVTGNLSIGCAGTPTEPVLYVGAKMMKDISKFPEETQAALAFTLLNIAKVCCCVAFKSPVINYDVCGGKIVSDKPLTDFMLGFENVERVTIAELPAENCTRISYINNKYIPMETAYAGCVPFAVIAPCVDGQYDYEKSSILTYMAYGDRAFPIVIYKTGEVICNVELSMFETIKDSYIVHLVSKLNVDKASAIYHTVEDLKVSIPKHCRIINILDDNSEEEDFIKSAPSTLTRWYTEVKSGLHESIPDSILSMLSKALDVSLNTGVYTFDSEAIKEAYKDDEYAQQLYTQVQPYYETFDLGTLSANLKGFAKGDLYSMLFAGDSGTGKSTAARVIPTRCGIPYISVNFSVNIEESDLFGSMIPNPTKSSADDPEFVWQDGVLTKAIRNGYCAVLEEINFARPGVLGKLNSLLDENRQIDLPTGEILKAHPNFRIIATCNVAYEGTNRFNKALINRFDDCTIFKDVERSKAISIIKNRTGYTNISKIDVIYNVYEAIKKYGKEQNLNLIISMRQLLNVFSKGKYYADAQDAIRRIMINGAFIEEPEYQDEFEKAVLPAFNLKFKI